MTPSRTSVTFETISLPLLIKSSNISVNSLKNPPFFLFLNNLNIFSPAHPANAALSMSVKDIFLIVSPRDLAADVNVDLILSNPFLMDADTLSPQPESTDLSPNRFLNGFSNLNPFRDPNTLEIIPTKPCNIPATNVTAAPIALKIPGNLIP